eukprot:CAMPEP_0201672356 /NCGR_PEP_ID=MMETSP0494-20130426/32040_1 /ASSEMBLY_ACC=CAM_ASM_000839 /TAXON_ID=420259 /ORGANISM="Thalassiosira gravida, Strain GMp14c1" /LENGTH=358 /DNA_ID=CAMNT_0048153981 /DNA_START=79 /DNA_END=1155 /DNA_ORIENTATION=-
MSNDASLSHPRRKHLPCTTPATILSPRIHVDHTYHDFSRYVEEGCVLPKQKKAGANFPANLQRILSDTNYSHIITWMPHGRTWKILDKELLMSTATPAYFGQSKFESFTRQLSSWGFKRLHQSGPDFGCYYHQCFLRGLPSLTALMQRVSTKQGKLIPHAAGEPRFYLISQSHPLPPPSDSNPTDNDSVSQGPVPATSKPEGGHGDDIKQSRPMYSTLPQPGSPAAMVTAPMSNHRLHQDLACLSLSPLSVHTSSTSTLPYDISPSPSHNGDENRFSMQVWPKNIAVRHHQDSNSVPTHLTKRVHSKSNRDFDIDLEQDFYLGSTQGGKQSDSLDEIDCNLFDAKDFLRFLDQLINCP